MVSQIPFNNCFSFFMPVESQTSNPPSSEKRLPWPLITLAVICLLWCGMVMGISLLETPVKFTAASLKEAVDPEIGRGIALDIGRTVFGAFNKVEIVWSVLSGVLFFVLLSRFPGRLPRIAKVLLPLLWLIVAFQSVVLVPALAARAQMVLDGLELPPAPYHNLYTATELTKLISLLTLGITLIRRIGENRTE